ncbi:hypothetical protein [Maridesulfovibrio sp.]|uniref:hypothetical protein n=1 Tax=Maridesulfovibrio sp. TaxID=2795000 RepID=UPI002A18C29C|nr:hypothetical protein [Maridesulfovibrio sp.]
MTLEELVPKIMQFTNADGNQRAAIINSLAKNRVNLSESQLISLSSRKEGFIRRTLGLTVKPPVSLRVIHANNIAEIVVEADAMHLVDNFVDKLLKNKYSESDYDKIRSVIESRIETNIPVHVFNIFINRKIAEKKIEVINTISKDKYGRVNLESLVRTVFGQGGMCNRASILDLLKNNALVASEQEAYSLIFKEKKRVNNKLFELELEDVEGAEADSLEDYRNMLEKISKILDKNISQDKNKFTSASLSTESAESKTNMFIFSTDDSSVSHINYSDTPHQTKHSSASNCQVGKSSSWETLYNGELSLPVTYWVFGIVPSLIINALSKTIILNVSYGAYLFFMLASATYTYFIGVGTWRSATKYNGPRFWAILAKISVCCWFISCALTLFIVLQSLSN